MPTITNGDRHIYLSVEDIRILEQTMFAKGRFAKRLAEQSGDKELVELINVYDRLALGLHSLTCDDDVCKNHGS